MKRSNPVKFHKNQNVENTNSDSLLSKLSVVQNGYRIDPFLKELCSDPGMSIRRSPAINRGYLARMAAVEATFEKTILLGLQDLSKVQVLSLGSGFDSTFFRLANMAFFDRASMAYFEVDFSHSVDRKARRIARSALLSSFFSDVREHDSSVVYDCGYLNLVGCDMTNTHELQRKLVSCGFDPRMPTLILTECSTTYVRVEQCLRLMSWLTGFLVDFVFFTYEQIRPGDAFGTAMVRHFEKKQSPIQCVAHYPTREDHEKRFRSLGWTRCAVRILSDFWLDRMNVVTEIRSMPEDFDEAAELMLKCRHYVIAFGYGPGWTGPNLAIRDDWLGRMPPLKEPAASSVSKMVSGQAAADCCSRFGHVAWSWDSKVAYVVGGYSPTEGRKPALYCLDMPSRRVVSCCWLRPDARLCHSACAVSGDVCYVFGGRSSPGQPSNNMWLFQRPAARGNTGSFIGGNRKPSGCAFRLSESPKKRPGTSTGNTSLNNDESSTSRLCPSLIHPPPSKIKAGSSWPRPRWGHSLTCTAAGKLTLIGGRNRSKVFDDVYELDLTTMGWSLKQSLPTGLYGHSAAAFQGQVVVTGGLVSVHGCEPSPAIYVYSASQMVVRSVRMDQVGLPQMLFGHTTHVTRDCRLVIIGGLCPEDGVCTLDLVALETRRSLLKTATLNAPLVHHCSLMDSEGVVRTIGGGTNCFSFGMHVNRDITEIHL